MCISIHGPHKIHTHTLQAHVTWTQSHLKVSVLAVPSVRNVLPLDLYIAPSFLALSPLLSSFTSSEAPSLATLSKIVPCIPPPVPQCQCVSNCRLQSINRSKDQSLVAHSQHIWKQNRKDEKISEHVTCSKSKYCFSTFFLQRFLFCVFVCILAAVESLPYYRSRIMT